jgi:uncharacterized membrane protein SirB2
MDVGMLHLHRTAVTLFLFFLFIKTILLLANKTSTLDKFRNKTKIIDMILGAAILLTGFYLLYAKGFAPVYLVVKIVAVFIAIPLGIVGLKKHSKLMAILSLLLFVYIYGVSETKSYKFKKDKVVIEGAEESLLKGETVAYGKKLYELKCIECHGEDGQLGRFKSANLVNSNLSREETKQIIYKGKGAMPSYKELSDQQLEALTDYLLTLRK